MFVSVQNYTQNPSRNWIILVSRLVLVPVLLFATQLSAQTVATYNFDDGTADGWVSFYGATTPVATTAAAYTGSYSLLTTTSPTGTGGPSISLNSVLLAGATYTITGWVELTPGESAQNANFTISRSDPTCSGGTCYDTIGAYTTGRNAGCDLHLRRRRPGWLDPVRVRNPDQHRAAGHRS